MAVNQLLAGQFFFRNLDIVLRKTLRQEPVQNHKQIVFGHPRLTSRASYFYILWLLVSGLQERGSFGGADL